MSNGFLFQPRNPLLKLHIHRWAEKHRVSMGLATAAQRLAVIAEPFHYIAHELRTHRVDARLPQRPPAHEWLRMYRAHHEVWRQLGDLFPGPLGNGSESVEALATDRALRRFVRDHPDEVRAWGESVDRRRFWVWFRRAYRHAWRDYLAHLREAKELLDQRDDGTGFDEMLAASSALHFFLAVQLPCIVEYEMLPIALLRRARAGDERAIEQLLRLDDMAIDDPFIKRWRDKGTGDERRRKVELVAQWTRQGVGGQLSIQGVKQSLAGLIALFAAGMPKATDFKRVYTVKLDSAGIRELFNAVARDRREGFGALQEDKDLFDLEPDSWRQAVSKKKRAWLGGLYDDAKSLTEERKGVEAELSAVGAEVPHLPSVDVLAKSAAAAFDEMDRVLAGATIEEKRELLGLYVEKIKADPDTHSVQIGLYSSLFTRKVAGGRYEPMQALTGAFWGQAA